MTGDNEQCTRHVCGELGLEVAGTLTGPEVAELTDEALLARVDDTTLFCRVTPPQKSRVISVLRRRGHVVGYLGDGINDAPSLHAADVGFSVDTAVDVAKEAAAMILLRKDLGVLADGVREGRKTFMNILKYMMMGTSSNFGNMFSMAGGVLFLPFLPMLPTQILLNKLLYDLSEATIPLDNVSDSMVARPRRWDLDIVRKLMFVFGPLSSIFDFATFGLLLWVFHAGEKLFQTGWFVESLATQTLVIFIIRTSDPLRDPPHPSLVASTLFATALAVALPYSPLASWLGFVPPPAALLGCAGARDRHLSCPRLLREALVLQALSAGLARCSSGLATSQTRENMFPLQDELRRPSRLPVVTGSIIALNVLVFILELTAGDAFVLQWSVIPADIVAGRHLITILTSMFMHGSWSHILGNMIFLWAFGPEIEDAMNPWRYAAFYLAGGIVAMLAQVAVDPGSTVPNLGASGAIAAVMGAFLITYPRDKTRTVLIIGWLVRVTFIPAALLIGFWFLIQLLSFGVVADVQSGGVAYVAHIAGMIFGAVMARPLEDPSRPIMREDD